jgi:hypothetical protein
MRFPGATPSMYDLVVFTLYLRKNTYINKRLCQLFNVNLAL